MRIRVISLTGVFDCLKKLRQSKATYLLALMLCLGAVFFPQNVYAAGDKTPPTILAWQEIDALHIEASGGQNGVEAVYINENRVNYNAVNNINLPLRSYAGTGRFISVYAVDYAGNKSNTIVINNPYYVPPAKMPPPPPTPEPTPVATLTPVTASVPTEPVKPVETAPPSLGNTTNPFTPAGTGTTVDNATSGDGKEFFTISSADGNVFHLIVDRQRATENVYLLNAVTEDDLMALATKSNKSGNSVSAIPTPEPVPVPTAAPAPTPEPTQTPEPQAAPPVTKTNNTGQYIILLLVVLGAGGVGYYFKIMKPRQQSPDDSDYDDDDDSESSGHEDDTDYEMEDDTEDGDDDSSDDSDE